MRSFITWLKKNHGHAISFMGVIPMIVPTALILLSDSVCHDHLKAPLFLTHFLLFIHTVPCQNILIFISTVGTVIVAYGQRVHYAKLIKEQKPQN